MDIRKILKRALHDPRLNIEAIMPEEFTKISTSIKGLSDQTIISEWLHTLGFAQYEYHIHEEKVAGDLQRLYSQGIRGGNPRLLRLYSKNDLKKIIRESSVV